MSATASWRPMRKAERSLRRRIVAAYVLLAAVLCSVFGAAAFFAVESIEADIIGQRLAAELDRMVGRQRQGLAIELPVGVRAFRGEAIPAEFRHLRPGLHEIDQGSRTLEVLVGHDGAEPLILMDDATGYEDIERTIFAVLAMAFTACLLLAWLLGRMSASRVIAPLTRLADAVQKEPWSDALPGIDSDDETGMLARAFAARSTELRRYLMRERLFAGDVSHELRTPLTVILGAAELLGARLGDQPPLAEAAERIRRTAFEATRSVAALLLLSRSPEALDAPRTALLPLIEDELERCRPLLAGKQVELLIEAEAQVHVFARPELASMAIGNLVRNACQATERGAVIVRLTAQSAVVEDSGPGLPDAVRDRLFERFPGDGEGAPGSGLGLAIVKRVAEHLGWELRLEDRAGGGTRFALVFPALNETLMPS